MICAAAAAYDGDTERSRALEERADAMPMEGYGLALDAPRLRIALAKNDLARVEDLTREPVPPGGSTWFLLSAVADRLDGLTAVGNRDAVEMEAPLYLKPRTYLEPFALRALGAVREDETLVRQALERFEAMHLDWHAEQTRALLST